MHTKYLVTSALPYVNNVPHLGNLIPILSADVFSKFLKMSGKKAIYICATDEHGTRTEIEAEKRNIDPDKYCKEMHDKIQGIFEWMGVEFDNFGRSSSKENHEISQHIFLKLHENGYIFEKELEQLYCDQCGRFLPDTYVTGECPHCRNPNAKGDQCDECTELLNPTELIDPRCIVCGSTPVLKKSNHLYLDLPQLEEKVKTWIESRGWEGITKNLPLSWIEKGLEPRCITRDLTWGVKVPLEGYEDKVFYVWFDAPIEYTGSTYEYTDEWQNWWLNPEETRLYCFMGKDNIPFHTLIWPSSLLGTGENWLLPHKIGSNEYLNYEGGQFSKSQNKGVFGNDIMDLDISPDLWRFYLMSIRPLAKDTDFEWEEFREHINNNLVGSLGNFLYRSLSFTEKHGGKIPDVESDKKIIEKAFALLETYKEEFWNLRFKEAVKILLRISDLGNQYFQKEEPWKLIKEDKKECKKVLRTVCEICTILGIAMYPLITSSARKVWKQLGFKKEIEEENINTIDLEIGGQELGGIGILFKKIDKKSLKRYRIKFKGKQEKGEKMISFDEFKKIEIKVGEIKEAERIEGSDKLLKLQVDIGEKRQLVAGLAEQYDSEELVGKKILVVANLEPAKLFGVESQGMLLAAVKGDEISLATVDEEISNGATVE
ncbi:MAG: methionine--tRNA ligase [Euryarchaeota archaeon]|nr:methionine--tRNA ligase [Euryarchaeota archaeon]